MAANRPGGTRRYLPVSRYRRLATRCGVEPDVGVCAVAVQVAVVVAEVSFGLPPLHKRALPTCVRIVRAARAAVKAAALSARGAPPTVIPL